MYSYRNSTENLNQFAQLSHSFRGAESLTWHVMMMAASVATTVMMVRAVRVVRIVGTVRTMRTVGVVGIVGAV